MALDLNKKVELVGLELKKNNVPDDIVARVVMVNDGSGSMQGIYASGLMQELNDRAMALAIRFDDDGSLEQYVFSDNFKKLPDATATMFGSYVSRYLEPACTWCGTEFSGVMKAIIDSYIPASLAAEPIQAAKGFLSKLFGTPAPVATPKPVVNPDTDPMLVLFQTDGECSDEREVIELMEKYHNVNIYWNFVGVGQANFRLLKSLADKYNNIGFFHAKDLSKISDEELYSALLNAEFCTWIKGITK